MASDRLCPGFDNWAAWYPEMSTWPSRTYAQTSLSQDSCTRSRRQARVWDGGLGNVSRIEFGNVFRNMKVKDRKCNGTPSNDYDARPSSRRPMGLVPPAALTGCRLGTVEATGHRDDHDHDRNNDNNDHHIRDHKRDHRNKYNESNTLQHQSAGGEVRRAKRWQNIGQRAEPSRAEPNEHWQRRNKMAASHTS